MAVDLALDVHPNLKLMMKFPVIVMKLLQMFAMSM